MTIKYVGEYKTTLRDDDGRNLATLIWGDPVHVLEEHSGAVKAAARAREGWLDPAVLSDESLLEIYVIDVGQGDGVLLKTPDGKWHLIDAGVAAKDQMTHKGTANFLRWKFEEDLGRDKVSLANVIVTHPDYDHYGGLLDVLCGRLYDGRAFQVEVGNFYHNGLGRFSHWPELGHSVAGKVDPFPNGYHGIQRRGTFVTELLDGRDSFAVPPREFAGAFAELAALVSQVPQNVRRLCHQDRFLPGYAPGQNDVVIHVLGPIMEEFQTGSGLRWLSKEAWTANGHSVVLRLDYGAARILLTGDLNTKSQKLLLSYHAASEFAVEVAKGCHHGAEDVHLDFLRAMQARATIVSSGDNENYAHPRPAIMGASARYGREAIGAEGDLMAPLLYSTELARSVKLAYAGAVLVNVDRNPETPSKFFYPGHILVKAQGKTSRFCCLRYMPFSVDLVYGLVNIRTDGTHILCATMEEKGKDFDVKVFKAGVDP